MLNLNNRKWKEFEFKQINIKSNNSKAYHFKDIEKDEIGLAYITRTSKNNGLSAIVKNNCYSVNPKNTLSFGAENADFFYHPYNYITGNKMYYLYNDKYNKYIWLFIKTALCKSTKNYFSFGYGMIPSRLFKKKFILPININESPDYNFMEAFIKELEILKKQEYLNYINYVLSTIEYKDVPTLEKKQWKEFFMGGKNGIFIIKSGKRLTTENMDFGNIPFIGSIDSNNGITNWVNTFNSSIDKNLLGVNYNGSVAESFYHGYSCIFSDDVKRLHLKNTLDNKYVLLFLARIIKQQKIKYNYGYKFNANRMKRQIILLPIDDNEQPDYEYMAQYIKNIMIKKYNDYKDFLIKSLKIQDGK